MIKFFRKIREGVLVKGKFGNYLLYALGEILLIALGIFMALQLQNWNETKKTEEATQHTLERIKKEILTNQQQINTVYDYHIMVRDTLNKIEAPKTEAEAGEKLRFWRGLRIFRLQNAAFQTAIQTGVSKDMNVDLLENLNALYTNQESYNDFAQTASQGLYSQDFSELENFKKLAIFLSMTMVDAYYAETNLKNRFEECLTKIDSLSAQPQLQLP